MEKWKSKILKTEIPRPKIRKIGDLPDAPETAEEGNDEKLDGKELINWDKKAERKKPQILRQKRFLKNQFCSRVSPFFLSRSVQLH